jgi:hypothetical protein
MITQVLRLTLMFTLCIGTFAVLAPTNGTAQSTKKNAAQKATPQSGLQPGDLIVQVQVPSAQEPVQATGMILSSGNVEERPVLSLEKIREGLYLASFSYKRSMVTKDSYASAIVTAADGTMAFGDMKSLWSPGSKDSFFTLPLCPSTQKSIQVDRTKVGPLETLVQYRAERRDTYKREINEILSGDLLESLTKLENATGLSRGTKLSPSLSPQELSDRLARLKIALKALKGVGQR